MWIEFRVEIERADWEDFGLADNIDMLWTHYKVLEYLDSQGYRRHQHILEDINRYVMIVKAQYEISPETVTWLSLQFPQMTTTRKSYEQVRIYE